MSQKRSIDSPYSLNGVEKIINSIVQWLFYYRMIWILLFVGAITFFSIVAWNYSNNDRIINIATVLTCGSIIVGIFYAILNYEMNYFKYKKEQKAARRLAAFQIASEWHKENIVKNLKTVKKIYEQHKHLIEENNSKEFSEILENNEEARSAFISIFNYLECIALGVEQGIHDENFVQEYFKSIFISYLTDYEFYIHFRRKKYKKPMMWIKFTELATKWRSMSFNG